MASPGIVSSLQPWLPMIHLLPTNCRFRPFRQFGNPVINRQKRSTCPQTLPSNSLRISELKLETDTSSKRRSGSNLHTGFDNLEVGAKYQFLVNAEHETILSLGVDAEIGGTGSQAIGADSFSTVVPGLFFGKGFGDLPDSLWILRPFALTGQIGVSFPTTSNDGEEQVPNNLEWGLALEYSLIYLQGYVKDVGLRPPFDRLIPVVEFPMETPLNRSGTPTTGTINPGVIWSGKYFQIGVEAVIPDQSAHGQ